MTHPRQIIRERIKQTLETVPELTGRVVTTRTRPTQTDELPAVIIYTLQETSEYAEIGRSLQRTLTVGIEVRASATVMLDDVLDELCELVETAMSINPHLDGAAFDTVLASTVIGLDGESESRQAVATLAYTVIYDTDEFLIGA